VQTGNVSHAYLFCGPRGTGKTTTARLLAKALLCEQAPTDQPDGSCLACREIADGLHPDVYELDAASRTGVENVREEIIGRVQFAPTRGSYKIYIIDEVHMLSTAAFNALLKTLEEPPSHVLFVLCTTDFHKVPDTIKSRCQQFEFHRLSEVQITSRLSYICDQEGFTAEPEALALIAQRSQGGMRDAIGSLEQVAVFTAGALSFEAAESLLGEVSAEQLFAVSEMIAARNVAGCFAWVAGFTQSGTDIAQFVRDLSQHVRNLYIAATLGDNSALAEIIAVDDEQCARYLEQARSFASADRLANALLVLGDLTAQLRYSANARLALEIALTRMARPDCDLTLESLAARIAVLEQSGGGERAGVGAGSGAGVGVGAGVGIGVGAGVGAGAVAGAEAGVGAASNASMLSSAGAATGVSAQAAPAPTAAAPAAAAPAPTAADAPAPTAPAPAPTEAAPVPEVEGFGELTADSARRLWFRIEKALEAQNKVSVATFLSGSSAYLDPKTGGLLIELPNNAAFAKRNLERPENKELISELVVQEFGSALALTYQLGAGGASQASSGQRTPSTKPEPEPVSAAVPADPLGSQPVFDAGSTAAIDFGQHSPSTEQAPSAGSQPAASAAQSPDADVKGGAADEETLSFQSILSASFNTEVQVDRVDSQEG
jgi:DNA polymerase-3 subunit gamma/tau